MHIWQWVVVVYWIVVLILAVNDSDEDDLAPFYKAVSRICIGWIVLYMGGFFSH